MNVPPDNREPFFTPTEWQHLAVFRPREWRGWWRTQSFLTKIAVVFFVALGALGLYSVARGDAQTGWFLIATVAALVLILFVFFPLIYVIVAAVRWVLRATGVASWWRRVRERALETGKVVFWVGVAVWLLAAAWPYFSVAHPVGSWYALTQGVPVERVSVEQVPHDCEFLTAPMGSKHCHYDAKIITLKGADTPDGKRSLVVTYERVEE
jgi:uncharacterized membrane protein